MSVVTILNEDSPLPLLLTCEHASCAVPPEYDDLGLDAADLCAHIGWDIGAAELTGYLARELGAAAALSGVSRLVVDCNRDLGDHDLIVENSHGVRVPGNAAVDADERRRRIREFYEPYHDVIDRLLMSRPRRYLLSVHSFTPELNGRERRFEVGILYDAFEDDARRVGERLGAQALRVRYNEPYSAFDGLIFSARTHGLANGVRYAEIEVNNRLLRDHAGVARLGAALAKALRQCWDV
jgi:predicted N-formylglutamate amidohydrolase